MTLFAMLMTPEEAQFFAMCMGSEMQHHVVNDYPTLHQAIEAGAARIISFCQPVIVPPAVLSRLQGQCFNFHPGPPELPGRNPATRAAEAGARTFGVTLHTMSEKVDAGPIHEVRRFPIPARSSPYDIEVLAYQNLLDMIVELGASLAYVQARFAASNEEMVAKRVFSELAAVQPDGSPKWIGRTLILTSICNLGRAVAPSSRHDEDTKFSSKRTAVGDSPLKLFGNMVSTLAMLLVLLLGAVPAHGDQTSHVHQAASQMAYVSFEAEHIGLRDVTNSHDAAAIHCGAPMLGPEPITLTCQLAVAGVLYFSSDMPQPLGVAAKKLRPPRR